mmetsp:Transcript_61373/g.163205  ORF Transcript_61373/g.163205 Transcript_61373/m.163205 type:complete len:255 (-) Transcript_61373:749-1513(-)
MDSVWPPVVAPSSSTVEPMVFTRRTMSSNRKWISADCACSSFKDSSVRGCTATASTDCFKLLRSLSIAHSQTSQRSAHLLVCSVQVPDNSSNLTSNSATCDCQLTSHSLFSRLDLSRRQSSEIASSLASIRFTTSTQRIASITCSVVGRMSSCVRICLIVASLAPTRRATSSPGDQVFVTASSEQRVVRFNLAPSSSVTSVSAITRASTASVRGSKLRSKSFNCRRSSQTDSLHCSRRRPRSAVCSPGVSPSER